MSLPMMIELISYDESRDIEAIRNPDGTIRELRPVPGSEKTFVGLRFPSGAIVTAEIPYDQFEAAVAPYLEVEGSTSVDDISLGE